LYCTKEDLEFLEGGLSQGINLGGVRNTPPSLQCILGLGACHPRKTFENICYLETFHIKFYAWFGKPTALEATLKIWELWVSSLEHKIKEKSNIIIHVSLQ